MDASHVVIHFIGLVLFSTQVSNDPGLHAILPAIHAAPQTDTNFPPVVDVKHLAPARALERSPGAAAAAAPARVSPTIEQHVALLIFHKDVIANDSQWGVSRITSRFPIAEAFGAYRYVTLTGEHITFVVDAPNDGAKLPKNIPRLSCAEPARLTSGYQWPYSKAAAVVDIPEGTLSACHAGAGRIDTRLLLKTTGTLTVVAVKSGVVKTLVLNTSSNPTILLANVPPPGEAGVAAAHNGARHFLAYYRMIGRDETSTCLGRPHGPPVPDCPVFPNITSPAPVFNGRLAHIFSRVRAIFLLPGSTPSDVPDPGGIPSINAECSNTQWP